MKNEQNSDYTLFKQKVYRKIAWIAVIAFVTVFLLRFIAANNNMGDMVVAVLQRYFHVSADRANRFYWSGIRRNLDYLTFAAVAAFFILLSHSLLSQFAGYFDEIGSGLDALVEDKDNEIQLSLEMASMESKLKTIKQTLKNREQEAKAAEQRKNDVVTYLAHDIRTPLTSVIGYLSLLDEAPDMPVEQKAKYIRIGLEKAYRLESLVHELFEITQYNLQTITLSKKNIDLSYMLVQMVDEAYPQLTAHNKKVEIHAAEELTVCGDPDKLARAFNNILKNAIVYGEDNSVIEITASLKNKTVIITFGNAGSIPKEKLVTVFDKFYRLDEARSSDTGGAGLGLAISKEIIVLHDGHIMAESEKGYTVIRVELPAVIPIVSGIQD